tara:strand:+ start:2445 stop:3089 length:645 start_codon:yes stop_codon:yes gene_type:complete
VINLDNVTLVCIDDLAPDRAYELLIDLNKLISFKKTKLFCSSFNSPVSVFIPPIKKYGDYDKFVITELHKHISTDFCMIVQRDGFFVNLPAWSDEFLNYDYIGAPWPDGGVGNGGFTIRSRRLLEFVANHDLSKDPSYDLIPEDGKICSDYRWGEKGLRAAGYTDAPTEIAQRFSIEGQTEITNKTFGFHGKHTFKYNKYSLENVLFKSVKIYF